jgi:hypothetical protein
MSRTPEEKLLNPRPGSKNDALINDMIKFENAVRKAKRKNGSQVA